MAWNGNGCSQSGAQAVSRKAPLCKTKFTITIGVIVGILVALVYYMARHESESATPAPKESKPHRIAVVAKPVSNQTKKVEQIDDERTKRIARLKAMTPKERLDFLYEEAKKRDVDFTPSTNRAFKTGVEQVMSWIFTTKPGDPPPPLPQISIFDEVHLAEIIIADNPVLETDSDRVKECKKTVALAKKELVAYIKEGGNLEDFLTYYRDQLREAYHDFTTAKRKIFTAYLEGEDSEVCRVYAEQINAELAQKGIKQVKIPKALIDKFSNPK